MIAAFSVFLTFFLKWTCNFPPITFPYLFPSEHLLGVWPLLGTLLRSGCVFLSDSISSCSPCAGPALCRRGSSISRTRAPSPSECVRKVGLFHRQGMNNLSFLSLIFLLVLCFVSCFTPPPHTHTFSFCICYVNDISMVDEWNLSASLTVSQSSVRDTVDQCCLRVSCGLLSN